MFVVIQCWDNLSPKVHTKPIHERIALTLKHAGMSITITSVTDIMAFAVGASTVCNNMEKAYIMIMLFFV
jgi:hypothetical protein